MNAGIHWIVAVAAGLLVGLAGTLYFRAVRRREETADGIRALSAMSWREYIHLLLAALAERGFARAFDREAPSGDDDYTLERNDERWLLSCKHGSAFVLGGTAVAELAQRIRLANAQGGILATQGSIAPEARLPASLQRIELLDGPGLWPELRRQLSDEQQRAILAGAGRKARQRTLLAWVLAVAVAGLCVFLLGGHDAPRSAPPPAAATPPAAAPAPARPAAPTPPQAALPASNDAAVVDGQRREVARAISTLPTVLRAVWTTQSTLQVYLSQDDPQAFDKICPMILHYDALAPSRIQLTPPPQSNAPTRFRQCRSY